MRGLGTQSALVDEVAGDAEGEDCHGEEVAAAVGIACEARDGFGAVFGAGGGVPEGGVENYEGCCCCWGRGWLVSGVFVGVKRWWERFGLGSSFQGTVVVHLIDGSVVADGCEENVPQKLGWLKSTRGAAMAIGGIVVVVCCLWARSLVGCWAGQGREHRHRHRVDVERSLDWR